MLLFLSVASAVPTSMTHQGRLLDPTGVPFTGQHDVDFALYDQATGGAALWTSAQTVTFDQGYYSAELTGIDDDDLPDDVWVGVTVDSGTEVRTLITAVPFARLAGGVPGLVALSSLSCSANQVPLYDGAAWSCVDASSGGTSTVLWDDIVGIPFELADGLDADTLATLTCGNGQILSFALGVGWQCADAPAPDWGTLAGIPSGFADNVDDVLDEAAVEAFVENGPLSLAAGTTIGGIGPYTDADAIAAVGAHYTDAQAISAVGPHYTDLDAIAAVGPHYTDTDAIAAVGTTFGLSYPDNPRLLMGSVDNGCQGMNNSQYGTVVTYPIRFDQPPVVLVGIDESINNSGATWTRIWNKDRARNRFAANCDNQVDSMPWLAIEAGRHTLDGKQVEAGTFNGQSGSRSFTSAFPTPPIVILTVGDANGSQHRLTSYVTTTGFTYWINQNTVVNYVAFEPGDYTVGKYHFEAGRGTGLSNGATFSTTATWAGAPAVLLTPEHSSNGGTTRLRVRQMDTDGGSFETWTNGSSDRLDWLAFETLD